MDNVTNRSYFATVKTSYIDQDDLLLARGFTIIRSADIGEWQGDHAAIVANEEGQIGWVIIGFGSCEGCDALLDAIPETHYRHNSDLHNIDCDCDWLEMEMLADYFARNVTYEPPPDGRDLNKWYTFERPTIQWLRDSWNELGAGNDV